MAAEQATPCSKSCYWQRVVCPMGGWTATQWVRSAVPQQLHAGCTFTVDPQHLPLAARSPALPYRCRLEQLAGTMRMHATAEHTQTQQDIRHTQHSRTYSTQQNMRQAEVRQARVAACCAAGNQGNVYFVCVSAAWLTWCLLCVTDAPEAPVKCAAPCCYCCCCC
eukprot:GHRQ01026758.1.p1 GENE.GHRQ01026758.1~~GHRQ01026758.1.p1  ORF type:complete len:165 (+),score=34.86 GHRQ01026758.1:792-1286(+)